MELGETDQRKIESLLNPDEKENLTFQEFILGLHNCAVAYNQPTPDLLQTLRLSWQSETLCMSKVDKKLAKYNARYDEMLERFGVWKAYIPEGEGRRMDILRGCFVGSENPKVVEALRVIYTDNAALRLSGDWIFKLVATLMGQTARWRNRH
jgi:hypothetical protein